MIFLIHTITGARHALFLVSRLFGVEHNNEPEDLTHFGPFLFRLCLSTIPKHKAANLTEIDEMLD